MSSKYRSVLSALQKATEVLLGVKVSSSDQNRPASVTPSAGRLIDITAFLLALELVGRSTDEEAPALQESGMALAAKLQDEYVADVEQILVPVFDGWGLRAFKTKWAVLSKPNGKDPELYTKRALLVLAVLGKLRSKMNVMHSIFTDGRVFSSAKALSELAEVEDGVEQMKLLSLVRPCGHMANTRSWMKHAFTTLGVDTPEFEEVISDVALAQDLGAKLKNVDVAITNAESDESIEKLQAERALIVDSIQEIAAQSVNPQAVLSSAATVAAESKHNYKSDTGRQLMLSPEQEDAMMVRGKSIIASGAGSGKCVTGDTLVTSTTGLRTIESWSAGQTDSLVSVDVENKAKISVENATWLDMGVSEVIELTTNSGIKLKATPEHPLLVWDGAFSWKRVDSLTPGDTVLVLPGHAAEYGTETCDPEYAYLLGLLMGDGWVDTANARIGWSRSGEMLPPHFYSLSEKFWSYTPKANPKIGTNSVTHWIHSRDIVTRLEKEGMAQSGARAKQTPAWLMQASKEERIRYLQGLFDTDATAGDRSIEYSTASEVLARQVHQLLIGLGIVGQLKPKSVEGYDHVYWRILISGDAARAFNAIVGFRYEFSKAEIADKLNDKDSNPNVGVYPHVSALLKEVKEDWKKQERWKGVGQSVLMDERWVSVKDYLNGKRRPSKAKLLNLANGCLSDAAMTLRSLANFYPDEVVSVVNVGQKRVYDFTVPSTHSFIANSIVSHNTRVMAGKVVYHVKELGAKPSQFIATSFSNKSAHELIDRIKKYGGANILEDGPSTEGFGTTHRVAGNIIRRYGNKALKDEKPLGSSAQTMLVRMAMEQVKMAPDGQVRAPVARTFFEEPKQEDEGELMEAPKVELSDVQQAAKQAYAEIETKRLSMPDWKSNIVKDVIKKIANGTLKTPSPKQIPYANDGFAAAGLEFRIKASVVSAAKRKSRESGPKTGEMPYWKRPANKWFNMGVGDKGFIDADGRAIGPKQVLLSITNWKANLVTPEQAFLKSSDVMAATYGAYEWLKNNTTEYVGWRDHDDTLIKACQVMVSNNTALSQLRTRFRYILVDEAQDLNKCVLGNTKVLTPSGEVMIADLQVGDKVLSFENGQVLFNEVKAKAKSEWKRGYKIRTASGRELTMSPDHRIYATPMVKCPEGQMALYLMYREDMGFRIGTTMRLFHHDGETIGRAAQERADAAWILEIGDADDILYKEQAYSLKYAIPTYIFEGQPRGCDQSRIDKLFREFGGNGRALLDKYDLSFGHPHWTALSNTRGRFNRRVVNLAAHRGKGKVYVQRGSTVQSSWTEEQNTEGLGLTVYALKGGRFTINKLCGNYEEAYELAHNAARVMGARVVETLYFDDETLPLTTAAALFPGMKVVVHCSGVDASTRDLLPIADYKQEASRLGVSIDGVGGEKNTGKRAIHEFLLKHGAQLPHLGQAESFLDEIVEVVEISDGDFFDITVDRSSNFFGNGILSHNCQHLLFGLIAGTYNPDTQEVYEDGKMSADTFTFVGDEKQAIYAFRGATPDKFINMSDLVENGQGFKTKLMETNYRSGRVIVDAANHLMSHNKKQIPMTCRAHEERKGSGVITAKRVATHEDGAKFAAEMVRDLCQGEGAPMSYKDFGVAARTNAELFAFGAEFLKMGIPFRSKINFFNNPTVNALLSWMRLANCAPDDKNTINEVVLSSYKAPNFNLNKIFDDQIQRKAAGQNYLDFLKSGGWRNIYEGNQAWRNERYVKPYTEMLSAVKEQKGSPTEVLNFIMELRGPAIAAGKPGRSMLEDLVDETKKSPEATDLLVEESNTKITDEDVRRLALAPIQPLLDLCANYQDLGPCMSYLEKLNRANDDSHKDDDPEAADYAEPAVVLDTVHGWKGLEAKHMFVPMAAGVFPHKRSMGDEDAMAAERRLGYVAITRGQDNVTILCPDENHVGKPAGPSQFVAEACIPVEGGEDHAPVQASFYEESEILDSYIEFLENANS